MHYKVEWNEFDPRTGFGWRGESFTTLLEATNFYHSLGKCPADLLVFEKYRGYFFLYAK